jgi:hypothetical protein
MMKKALLLAAVASTIDEAKGAIEASAGVSLAAHESAYRGGDYFRGDFDGVNLVLQTNFIEDDGEPAEAEFPEVSLLIYLDGEIRAVDLVASRLVTMGKVLRSSTY